jgi:hypothetical protein
MFRHQPLHVFSIARAICLSTCHMLSWFTSRFPLRLPIIPVRYLDYADCTRCLCSVSSALLVMMSTYEVTILSYDPFLQDPWLVLQYVLSLRPPWLSRDMSFWVEFDHVYDLLIQLLEPSFRIPKHQRCDSTAMASLLVRSSQPGCWL